MNAGELVYIHPRHARDAGRRQEMRRDRVLLGLRRLAPCEGDLLPRSAPVLARLLRGGMAPAEVNEVVDGLVDDGSLRLLVVGSTLHIALLPEALDLEDEEPPGPAPTMSPDRAGSAETDRDAELTRFQRQLELDAEREKLLMYRALMAVQAVFGLALVREWVLWLAG